MISWTASGIVAEVASHAFVGDGDGAAPLDLAAEDRDHAAGRAEHVTEAEQA